MDPFESGMITCASAFGAIFMKAIAQRVLAQFGFRRVLIVNAALAGLALSSYGLFTHDTPVIVMIAVVAFGGFFPSLQFTCLNSIVYADIASADASRATSLASVVQQLSLGLGVTISGMVLQASSRLAGHEHLTTRDFLPAFLVIGLFAWLSIPVTRHLAADAGTELARMR
jgi:predicted MFS family arabinose efflux permease